jgi:hypothetical protein
MARYKTYYHATDYDNYSSIMKDGLKASAWDGLVYLTEKEQDAVKFPYVHMVKKIITFRVVIEEPEEVVETFDHSYAFFGCRCFGFPGDIPVEWIHPSRVWTF